MFNKYSIVGFDFVSKIFYKFGYYISSIIVFNYHLHAFKVLYDLDEPESPKRFSIFYITSLLWSKIAISAK